MAVLLEICEFHGNRHREGRTFLTGVSDITFEYQKTMWYTERKERLGNVCVPRPGLYHVQYYLPAHSTQSVAGIHLQVFSCSVHLTCFLSRKTTIDVHRSHFGLEKPRKVLTLMRCIFKILNMPGHFHVYLK
jgi:hypothetical protein